MTSLELFPLAAMTIELRRPFVLDGTPCGTRLIFEVEHAVLEGERLRGKATGSANGDWLVVGPDGTGTLDVRSLLETDDGALIYVQYSGRVDATSGPPWTLYSTPRFETGDDRYRWLNLVQAVGKGWFDGQTLSYDLFELR